ncbi:hypothetical protein [Anaerosalibacter bizertensis]|uniref:hypothetical protein n=1 Tax=Anaerosalibacter bizertensis TaxID=932217 RepID=UPI0012B349E3|nr:hypothetical protein [Anaerosalibacter bizertensis]
MSDEEFWRSTPRKIGTLWKLHLRFHDQDSEEKSKDKGVIYKRVNITDVPCLN